MVQLASLRSFRGAKGDLVARRRFQRPTGLDGGERVWIVILVKDPVVVGVRINDAADSLELIPHRQGVACDVTDALRSTNVVTVEFDIDRLISDDGANPAFAGALFEIRASDDGSDMTTLSPASTPQPKRFAWMIAAIVVIGITARMGVIALWPDKLLADTDAYLAYANSWVETGTFGYEGRPTAYRPPGYPWLLSLFGPPSFAWIAIINVLSGAGTIVLVWLTARRLGMTATASALSAALIAIDPLLVLYSGQAMTESLCTFESALLLWLIANVALLNSSDRDLSASTHRMWLWSITTGVVLGLSILTRPTFLVFGALLVISIAAMRVISRRPNKQSPPSPPRGTDRNQTAGDRGGEGRGEGLALRPSSQLILFIIGMAIPVGTWGVRNQMYLGSPVITTTHGGYTLILGNNEAFYEEVVDQPIGIVWDGSHGGGQQAWADDVNRSLADRGLMSEVERDQALRQEAVTTIRTNPGRFTRACGLRLLRFWSVVPSADASNGLPTLVTVAVAGFYVLWWLLCVAGCRATFRKRALALLPSLLLIVSFMSLHLVYWTNARMRAPVLPALALLAAMAVSAKFQVTNDEQILGR